jgi:C4-dicarboxylate-specific signal transduction histidine kinase
VNVSATIVADRLGEFRIGQFGRLVSMLEEHQHELSEFLGKDPRGHRVIPYMGSLSRQMEQEREQLSKEVGTLAQHINHIKEIVAMQQTYARSSGVFEKVEVSDLIEDAVGVTHPGLERHHIDLHIEDEPVPPILTDRHKVLQILLNLLRNAKDSLKESGRPDRQITIQVKRTDEDKVAIQLADNGIGIPGPNLVRIFSHGFTTKKDGHGFGLHSGALAAKQLGGSLTAASEGTGTGAVFTLELPIHLDLSSERRMAS